MAPFSVKILESSYINHDVKRFIMEKPDGYHFVPGQGAELSINMPEWKDQWRPFTFTSLNKRPYLEFLAKIYNERNGVTKQLGKTNAGAALLLQNPFGSIRYSSPGTFIAAGTGITPFLSIFRDLQDKKQLSGNTLILSNKYAEDIIYPEELIKLLGYNFINIFTREGVIGFTDRRIDRRYLVENIRDFSGHFYICGPQIFVNEISTHLLSLGATADTLTFEQ